MSQLLGVVARTYTQIPNCFACALPDPEQRTLDCASEKKSLEQCKFSPVVAAAVRRRRAGVQIWFKGKEKGVGRTEGKRFLS